MPVSFAPDDAVKGGLFDNVTVEWSNCRFTSEPPPGYPTRDRVFLACDLTVVATGEKAEGYWSFGDLTKYTILDDGDKVDGPGLNDSTNAFYLFKSLADKAFPKEILKAGSCKALNGLVAHMVRFRPTRAGLEKDKKEGQQDAGTLIVEEIKKLPGEKGRSRAAAKNTEAASSASSSAPAAASGDIEKLADSAMTQIVAAAGDAGQSMKSLKVNIFRALGDSVNSDTKNEVAAHVTEEWLKEHGYTVKDGKITM